MILWPIYGSWMELEIWYHHIIYINSNVDENLCIALSVGENESERN